MKKFYLLTILTLSGYLLHAQEYYISFQSAVTGTQIDSILVTNQKTSQKVKLLENEQLLLTKSTTGIPTLQSGFEAGYLYPNPCHGDAGFFFSTDKSGEVVLGIYNASGQLLNRERQDLAPGLHRFQVKFPAAGIYFISVMKNGGPLSFKAVCLGNTFQMGRITYEGSEKYNYSEVAVPLKSLVSGKTMNYSTGDLLYYSSFSGKNNTILTDSPTADKVYPVEFFECKDPDNQNYPIVKIGNQWWMAENLKTTKYKDGAQIANITDNTTWAGLTTSAYCWHDNNTGNKTIYGALYNWYAVNTGKLCPNGWHVPTDAEWTALENYLVTNVYNYDGTTTGNKIAKSLAAPITWALSSVAGTVGNSDYPGYQNKTGFSALPGGNRGYDGSFGSVGNSGLWWSSTGVANIKYYRFLSYSSGSLIRASTEYPSDGFSVRCVRDILPTVITNPITDITQTTATGGGNVTSEGGATVTERGVCWSTSQNPTTTDSKTSGTGTGSFTSHIAGLTANTIYYVRAYATNSSGTEYGSQVSFTTRPNVTTNPMTSIWQTTATGGGYVTNDGGATVTARGVCWNTTGIPTTSNSKTIDGAGTGSFISSLTGLTANTTYYVRAYATNSGGTVYGGQVFFTTLPNVTTNSITPIWQTTATGGGNVTYDGGAPVFGRGVCWNTTGTPTTSNSKTIDGTGTGSFISNLSGLTANTLYYVRAFATNSGGTAYGNQVSFTTTPVILPTVTTNSITAIAQTAATGGGNVTSDGGGTVTARGVCWNIAVNPTTAHSKTVDGTGTGAFTSSMTGLTAGTLYYVRAYATNSAGTAYGEQKQFHAKNQTGLFQDSRDQTFYYWVKIGTQTWMSSNLSYLPGVSPSSSGSGTSPYYYVYNYQGTDVLMARNLIDNKGVLYNWPAALSACPPGWHLPTDAEWTTLENYMIANVYNYDGTTTGNKIAKSLAVTSSWNTSTNTGAIGNNLTDNNISGFSALPGGYRYISGVFGSVGSAGLWWSSSEASVSNAWGRVLNFDSASANRNFFVKTEGFSVRCLKD
jgi:uncharacterized protein (TIGR02145 family)